MNNEFNSFYSELQKKSGIKKEQINGCSLKEINKLEEYLDINLPDFYKDFLFKCGLSAGGFLKDVEMFYESLFELKKDAEDLLAEWDLSLTLFSDKLFVFSMYQGYQFMYFDLNETKPDPSVYLYVEGDKNPQLIHNKFSEYLMNCLRDQNF